MSTTLNGLRFSGFTVTYDLDCHSQEYSTPSVMMFKFSNLDFNVQIGRKFVDKTIFAVVTVKEVGTFEVRQFPDNAYMQIIAAEINPVMANDSKKKFIATISKWETILQKLYDKAIKEIAFPELCYYCP